MKFKRMYQNSLVRRASLGAVMSSMVLTGTALSEVNVIEGNYAASAVGLYEKNLGELTVTASKNCFLGEQEAIADMEQLLAKVKGLSAAWPAINSQEVISIDDVERYQIVAGQGTRLGHLAEPCAGTQHDIREIAQYDLDAKVYTGKLSITLKATENIAAIGNLKQVLDDEFGILNESVSKQVGPFITVGKPIYSLDEETKTIREAELKERAQIDTQLGRLTADREFSGGFLEVRDSVTRQSHARPAVPLFYEDVVPELVEASGSSKLEATYRFKVTFLPENTGISSTPEVTEDDHLSRTFSIDAEYIVPTDYYEGTVSVSTGCHESYNSARLAGSTAIMNLKDLAEQKIGASTGKAEWNRVEIAEVEAPKVEYNFTPVQFRDETVPGSRYATIVPVAWVDNCRQQFISGVEESELPGTWMLTQTFKIKTTEFATFEALAELATALSEETSGATAVIASISEATPKLDTVKHQESVDYYLYREALMQLADPNGDVAKFLIEENNASYAYYELEGPAFVGRSFRSVRGPEGLESGALADVSVIPLEADNLAPERIVMNAEVLVRWTPVKDLVKIIKENREQAGAEQ